MIDPRDGVPARWRIALTAFSILALIAMLTLRLLGPSDLYDQTQPKTIAYTTDIIISGGTRWILPIERGELPATKPPLYNWLAVPGVKWLGFNSEIAHKLPSIAAMLTCWLIIVRLGNRLDASGTLGWLAAICFASNYAIFKLGYLARPDMLLTLCLLIAWVCATRAFSPLSLGEGSGVRVVGTGESSDSRIACDDEPPSPRPSPKGRGGLFAVFFWLAVTLAAMTKGPAALVVVIFAVTAARVIAGRFIAIRLLHPIIGSLFAMMIFGAWVFAVGRINPAHLHEELWFNEIYGRITGIGREGTHHGTRELVSELPYQAFYFLTRFAPWSLFAMLAMLMIAWPAIRSRFSASPAAARSCHCGETQLVRAAALFVVLTIAAFSLSVGKRADYIAIAIPQASILAAWHLLRVWPRIGLRAPWLAPLAAAITLGAITYYDRCEMWSPQPGFGNAIRDFTQQAAIAMAAAPGEALAVSAGRSPIQAMLGISAGDQRHLVADAIARDKPFWVIAGRTFSQPHELNEWLKLKRWNVEAEAVIRSADLPRAAGWPGQVTLWRVTPR